MKIKCLVLKNKFERLQQKLDKYLLNLQDNANVFIIYTNEYDKKHNIKYSFLDAIDLCLKNKLQYINTIITINENTPKFDNIQYVLWFSKDKSNLIFNKDLIREKSIWKDVEWGKREKNYNPKGKDPGNVWIPTNDDGKGHITEHILLSEDQIVDRIQKMSNATNQEIITDLESVDINSSETQEVSRTKKISSNTKNISNLKYEVVFDSSENMKRIQDNSVSLVVTSPPYWDLKNYFKSGQIGQENYDTYLKRMESVWKECIRILKKEGTIWVNINIRVKDNRPILIPNDYIKQFKKAGLFLKQIFIWHKSSGIPTGAKNIVDRHEYVLVFAKKEDIKIKIDNYNDYKNEKINQTNIWNINRKAGSIGKKYIHPAIYPTELTNRIIETMTTPGDIVCDPFLGSGTTLISCLNLKRSFVGFEYNEGFQDLIISRIESDANKYRDKVKYIRTD